MRAHLQILNTVTELDPTLRQLTSSEKYRRSVRILGMAGGSGSACEGDWWEGDEAGIVEVRRRNIDANAPAHVTNEAAEGVLALAEKLWRAETACDAEKASELNALGLIMKKLAS